MTVMFNFDGITGFDWDSGNIDKNLYGHDVEGFEAEQVFFNNPIVRDDPSHSIKSEKRYYALGETDHGRFLFVAFCIRDECIRVISARDMNEKERRFYERNERNTHIQR